MINLKYILMLRGETFAELARALGVHIDTVYAWGRGDTDPHTSQKEALAEHLCCSYRLLDDPALIHCLRAALADQNRRCQGIEP